jgi:hypothetical protein
VGAGGAEAATAVSTPELGRLRTLLTQRGLAHVTYADWLRIELAEKELAAALGRGARVKLGSRAELHRACGLLPPDLR